jgi:hypothetical protein
VIGIFFIYGVRRQLLKYDFESLNPWTIRLVALGSLTIWFMVAASGRWIGFS